MVEWEEDEERNAFDIYIYLVVLLFKRCFHFCYLKEVIKPNEILLIFLFAKLNSREIEKNYRYSLAKSRNFSLAKFYSFKVDIFLLFVIF